MAGGQSASGEAGAATLGRHVCKKREQRERKIQKREKKERKIEKKREKNTKKRQ